MIGGRGREIGTRGWEPRDACVWGGGVSSSEATVTAVQKEMSGL